MQQYRPFGLLGDVSYTDDDQRRALGMSGGGASGATPNADAIGQFLYGLTNVGGMQDAAGLLGGPSLRENLAAGNKFDATMQGVGMIPVVGGAAKLAMAGIPKAARAAAKMAKAVKAEQAASDLATRSAQPEGLLSPPVQPGSEQSMNMKPAQALDIGSIRTKQDWRAKVDELSSVLAKLEGDNSDLLAAFTGGKTTADDVSALFEKYGVSVKSEASKSWSDRHGPSFSNYFHFKTASGKPETFRLSDHDYAPAAFDYRFDTPIQKIENDLLRLMDIQSSNENLDKYRKYLSAIQQIAPIKEDLWKLRNINEANLPSATSKRFIKKNGGNI